MNKGLIERLLGLELEDVMTVQSLRHRELDGREMGAVAQCRRYRNRRASQAGIEPLDFFSVIEVNSTSALSGSFSAE